MTIRYNVWMRVDPKPHMPETDWTAEALADPHAVADKSRRVRAMFARIAGRYDLANRVHTFGRDKAWRRAAARAAAPHPGEAALDVACGTGDLAGELLRAGATRVTGLDCVEQMLDVARRKFAGRPIEWVLGDAMAMPFADEAFDVVTIGFGLRNLPDTPAALREFHRVLRPAGRLVVLEFARPDRQMQARLYRFFASRIIPITGAILTGDRGGAFKYLTASIETYLTLDRMHEAIGAAGFIRVRSRRMGFAPIGLHVAVRPSGGEGREDRP